MRIFGDGKSGAAKVHSIEVMQEVKTYWESLRNGHPIPYRSDVDPRRIQKLLKHAFILERIAPGMARLRVSCNTLSDVMDIDMRGMPMSALINGASRDSFAEVLERVFSAPAVGRVELTTRRSFGRSGLQGEMMLLPLRSDSGEVNRILGAITIDGEPTRSPQRFDMEGSFLRRIEMGSEKASDPIATILRPQKVSMPKFDPATHFAQADETPTKTTLEPTKHAHLRLVVSNT
ncbi:PAS domain-containing protein [Shimia sp. R10_1]|uniref:PAS domain-containing protein n=1 Tax=Shimia sp. R10_1 TaxID=2821095 RepID=UPI001ADA6AA3|nr:PAS domain-containing protein [Shimia sp. R10_1]